MSELRQNLVTREWVVIAPERLKGSHLQAGHNALLDMQPEHDPNCPFCLHPENPGSLELLDTFQQGTILVRAIENKYKILAEHASCPLFPEEFEHDGIYRKFLGCGNHEVILESAVHNRGFATMTQDEIEAVVEVYLRRHHYIRRSPNNLLTLLFKNHGAGSGASQAHPHSQILGMRVIPNYVRFLLDEAQRHFDSDGVCVFCRILNHELELGKRVVYCNDTFMAYVPYAATTPYEINILPRRHSSNFTMLSGSEIPGLSDCLRATMAKLYHALSNPDFNIVFRNPPCSLAGVPFYHWHLKIIPHLTTPGGFELGAGMSVNVMLPEDSAADLRAVVT